MRAAERDAEAFTPLGLIEWLQRWWRYGDAWRDEQRKIYGQDTAAMMRGVADMIEGIDGRRITKCPVCGSLSMEVEIANHPLSNGDKHE